MFETKSDLRSSCWLAARLAGIVAAACLQHDEYQDAAAIYRLLLCEDCGLYAPPGDEALATRARTGLLHVLARLDQVTPVSVNKN